MSYAREIFKAIRYIESRLTEEIILERVAASASYSMYHFHRLFHSLTGATPGEYIRIRRLTKAAERLVMTKQTILEIALAFQFGSQEAFSRSFQKVFGMPPGRYRKTGVLSCPSLSPDTVKMQLMHVRGGGKMKPEIITLEKKFVIGLNYYGDNEQAEIPHLWYVFSRKRQEIKNKKGWCAYGLCIEPEDYESTGEFHYVACLEVEDLNDIPLEMVGKVIPANTYAVFTHKGPVSGLRDTYAAIYGTWVKETDMTVIRGFDFELYDDRFTSPDDPGSEIDIYIPITMPDTSSN
jgi:AraC family transcriptional regulator